jgi:hypothetical protein
VTLWRYFGGVLLMAVATAPVLIGAYNLRAGLLPGWSRAPARVAEAVMALAGLIGIGQALGAVGLFRPWMVLLGCLVVGATAAAGGRHLALRQLGGPKAPAHRRGPGPPPRVVSVPALHMAVAAVATGLVAGTWSTRVIDALNAGIGSSDSVWYHLPFSARFLQEGRVDRLHFVNGEAFATFHPANSELLHALGFLPFHHDFVSPFVNFFLLPLTLLAAWCIGRPRGVGPAAVVGTAVILASPVMSDTQPGQALNDVLALFFLLAAVALLMNAEGRRAALGLSGVAAGLALGTRITMVLPVLVLGFSVVVLTPRPRRRAMFVTWASGALLAGSFWWVRNLLHTGSPVPHLALGIGPLSFPSAQLLASDQFGVSVARFLVDGRLWRLVFRPGLALAFGPGWLLVLGLSMAGGVLAASFRGRAVRRAAGVAALASIVGYCLTPSSAFGANVTSSQTLRQIVLPIFAFNLRYLAPALAMGLTLLPQVPALSGLTGRRRILVLYAGLLFAQVAFDEADLVPGQLMSALLAGVLAVMLFYLTVMLGAGGRRARRSMVQWGAVLSVLVLASWPVLQRYLVRRYSTVPLYSWAADLKHARIGFSGFAVQYPLYGVGLSNYVQYVGRRGAHGSFSPINSCRQWREVLRHDHYDYVVVPMGSVRPQLGYDLARWDLTGAPPEPPESAWTRADPAAFVVFQGGGAAVYQLDGEVSFGGCPDEDPSPREVGQKPGPEGTTSQ